MFRRWWIEHFAPLIGVLWDSSGQVGVRDSQALSQMICMILWYLVYIEINYVIQALWELGSRQWGTSSERAEGEWITGSSCCVCTVIQCIIHVEIRYSIEAL